MITCDDCKHDFMFDRVEDSHFQNGICFHCQRQRMYGSVPYSVTLRDSRNGFTRTLEETFIMGKGGRVEAIEMLLYLYTEGNNSCDCNRASSLYDSIPGEVLSCDTTFIDLVSLVVDGDDIPLA